MQIEIVYFVYQMDSHSFSGFNTSGASFLQELTVEDSNKDVFPTSQSGQPRTYSQYQDMNVGQYPTSDIPQEAFYNGRFPSESCYYDQTAFVPRPDDISKYSERPYPPPRMAQQGLHTQSISRTSHSNSVPGWGENMTQANSGYGLQHSFQSGPRMPVGNYPAGHQQIQSSNNPSTQHHYPNSIIDNHQNIPGTYPNADLHVNTSAGSYSGIDTSRQQSLHHSIPMNGNSMLPYPVNLNFSSKFSSHLGSNIPQQRASKNSPKSRQSFNLNAPPQSSALQAADSTSFMGNAYTSSQTQRPSYVNEHMPSSEIYTMPHSITASAIDTNEFQRSTVPLPSQLIKKTTNGAGITLLDKDSVVVNQPNVNLSAVSTCKKILPPFNASLNSSDRNQDIQNVDNSVYTPPSKEVRGKPSEKSSNEHKWPSNTPPGRPYDLNYSVHSRDTKSSDRHCKNDSSYPITSTTDPTLSSLSRNIPSSNQELERKKMEKDSSDRSYNAPEICRKYYDSQIISSACPSIPVKKTLTSVVNQLPAQDFLQQSPMKPSLEPVSSYIYMYQCFTCLCNFGTYL